jgi:hypothetical protein
MLLRHGAYAPQPAGQSRNRRRIEHDLRPPRLGLRIFRGRQASRKRWAKLIEGVEAMRDPRTFAIVLCTVPSQHA